MAKIKIPRIKEFPSDGQLWRVDWVGALVRSTTITTEPFVQILLSPLVINVVEASSKDLASVKAVDSSKQEIINVGVGLLPIIAIGSIWKNGLHQGVFSGTSKSFSDLKISKNNIKFIPASYKINNQFLIPQSQYKLGTGLNSWLVAVEYRGNPYGILIPAIELIRFYYAISTNLAQAIFSGAFRHDLNSIVHTDRVGYIEAEDRVLLGLRQHVTDEEGWAIARILHSQIAYDSCLDIHDDFLQQAANGLSFINVKANFPFLGSATIQARVKPIPFEQDGFTEWNHLVLSLESCSAPMPYSELTVIRDNDGGKASSETDIPEHEKKPYARGGVRNNGIDGKDIQNQKDTNASLLSVSVVVFSGRFTVLAGRKPDKPTKEQTEYRNVGSQIKGVEVSAFGTGTGGYGYDEQEIQRINAVADRTRRKAAPPSFELFEEAIEHLNQQKGVSASIRQGNDMLGYMPLIKPPERWQWGYLDSAQKIRRGVIVADIEIDGSFFSLVEFEQREKERCTLCLLVTGGSRISDVSLRDLLHQCSSQKGVWKNITTTLEVNSLKHTWFDLGPLWQDS